MADDDPEPRAVVASEDDKPRSLRDVHIKKIGIVAAAVLLLVIGGFLLWPVIRSTAGSGYAAVLQKVRGSCSGDYDLLRQYNATVKKSGITKLATIQKTVESKPHYKADPTCVYIVTLSQFGQNDAVAAQQSFETLKKLESENKTPSSAINDGIDKRGIYDLIQTQIDDSKKGYYGQG